MTAALKRWQFWRAKRPEQQLGLFVSANAAWACKATAEHDVRFYSHQGDWSALFSELATNYGAATLQLVLAAGRYQVLTVDRPNVPEDEMQQALLWSVKDMVQTPVTDIHLDYFEFPSASASKIQVVITDRRELSKMALAAQAQGLEIVGISIEELMPANLFEADNQARLVVSHVPGEDVFLTVVKNRELWMFRRVRGFSALDSYTEDDLRGRIADSLSLELQRSMDFFESQMRQAPVNSIELLCSGERQLLGKLVSANFNQPVNLVEAADICAKFAELGCLELSREEA
ncbi:MSHA biogenesis protein MshI [Shewanella avicenniae]|uniref:MSHA biogenesis protein MshI n=1 Tax=Shewanella avicenniae TaxID=2814294 RepID=A0ABX7QQJ0_9GAMM|nr:MSHA biogenesis protein MshI [Shewanella avicenniae]QSX33250.1 MSHA biogenesis protein MshI [Shewanella avicenniae]